MEATSMDSPKTAAEIASLVKRLTPKDQAYVLNMINTLLFNQQRDEGRKRGKEVKKTPGRER